MQKHPAIAEILPRSLQLAIMEDGKSALTRKVEVQPRQSWSFSSSICQIYISKQLARPSKGEATP